MVSDVGGSAGTVDVRVGAVVLSSGAVGGVSAVGGVGGMHWAVGSHPAANHRLTSPTQSVAVPRARHVRICVVRESCFNIGDASLLSLAVPREPVIAHQRAIG